MFFKPEKQSLGTHFLILFLKMLSGFTDLMSIVIGFHIFSTKFVIDSIPYSVE